MMVGRLVIVLASVAVVMAAVGWVITASHTNHPIVQESETPTHHPIYADQSLYDGAFAAVSDHGFKKTIRGAIVNHHLLAASFITDTLFTAAKQNIRRVILISPNHFSAGRGWIASTDQDWLIPGGKMITDRTVIDRLAMMNLLNVDETPWPQEHGIFNILPVLAKYFPDATLVPIILKNGTPDELVDQVAIALSGTFDDSTLVVGSFDFSHNKTDTVADQHDEASMKAVQNLDLDILPTLDTDSPVGLRLFLQLMRGDGATNFSLFHHSNSAKITGRLNATDTTSYITGVFTR